MLTAVGTFAGVGFYAFSRGIKGTRFRSQPWQKVRTKTCPLFGTERMWTAVGTLLALASTHSAKESRTEHSGRSPGRRCGPKPLRFFGRKECGLRSEPCCCWLLRIQPRNQGQEIPAPGLAESADQNLSVLSNRKKCGLRSEPCCCWLPRSQPRNQGQQFPAPALAVSTDQNPSASWWPPDLARSEE